MKVTRYYIYQDDWKWCDSEHNDLLEIADTKEEAQQWCKDWAKSKLDRNFPNLTESDEAYNEYLQTFICSLSIIPKEVESEEIKVKRIKQSIGILNAQVQVLFNNDERKIAEQIDEAVSQLEEKYL